MIISFIALEKMRNDQSPYRNIVLFFTSYVITVGFSLDLLILVLFLPFIFIPNIINRYIIKSYIFFKYKIHDKTPPKSIQIENNIDRKRT